jgi:serine/threonine-protein kinase
MLGGRYRLDERIAGGGMGDVWRGTDDVLGRTVAVKILLAALLDEPGFAERFRGEARTMATINHPGVVDVYDYGNESGTAFLVMEYIEGDALSRTLSRVGRLTPARTMALMAQAADALHAAHEKGIVHRDVKPGNLLVRPNGTLVLTDFGIARSAAVGQLTAAGSVLGTASYISPEQAAGQGATPLSDVYALGVVAYQCLSGRRPFEGDNPLEIAMRHVRDTPPPLPPDIPVAARQIVETAMAKDPAARYPSAAALGQVARRAAGQLAAASTAARPAVPPSGMPGSPMAPGHPGGPPGSPVGAPVSGPAGMPMSGPPGSPVSGPSGHPGGPVSAMPSAGFQPGPVSGSPPGGYQPGPVSGGPAGGYQPGPVSGGPYGGAPGGPGPDPAKPGPISGPPAGATSGPPSGPPGDVAAGGTRVMPAGAMPTGPAGPGGPPPAPGQFARGAAGVPPPPQRESDTGYTYAQTSMVPPGGPGAPGAAPAAPANPKRTGLFALIAGIGALVLILCVGGGVFLVNNLGNDDKPPSNNGGATTAPPTGPVEKVDCDDLKGKRIADVRNHLEKTDGFKVKEVEVASSERAGTVVDVQPCGDQPKGSEVTVSVSNGRGEGDGGPSGGPNPSCGGGFPFGTRCPPSTRR